MGKANTSVESAIIGIATFNPITAAIATLYSVGKNINEFIDEHIEKLKLSESHVIACTGRVLEGAKFGFGLGYISSVAIIAVGQLILGNNLLVGAIAATGTVGSAALLANPIAMTCGAIGAICYGWAALTDQEKDAILDRVKTGLEIGVELIKSLIDFVSRKMSEFLDSKHFAELKLFVKAAAQQFGKTLFDITGSVSDFVKDATDKAGEMFDQVVDSTTQAAMDGVQAASNSLEKIGDVSQRAKTAVVSAARNTASKLGKTPRGKGKN